MLELKRVSLHCAQCDGSIFNERVQREAAYVKWNDLLPVLRQAREMTLIVAKDASPESATIAFLKLLDSILDATQAGEDYKAEKENLGGRGEP